MSHSNGNGYQSHFDEQFTGSGNDPSMNHHDSDQWTSTSSPFEGLDMDQSHQFSSSLQPHESWRDPQSHQNKHGATSLDGAMDIDLNLHSSQSGNQNLRETLLKDPGNSYASFSIPNSIPNANANADSNSASAPNADLRGIPSQPAPNGLASGFMAPSSEGNNISKSKDLNETKTTTQAVSNSKVSNAKPSTKATASSSTSRRSSPSPLEIINKIKSGTPPSQLKETIDSILSKLDVSKSTSSDSSDSSKQTTPSERKDLIERFKKSSDEPYLKLMLEDPRGRALFSSWVSDATPGKDETESKSRWVGTLVPLLKLLYVLPITLIHLSDREAGLGKKVKTLQRRPSIGDVAMKLVDMILLKWEKLVSKSAPEKRPAEGDELPQKATKLVKSEPSQTSAKKSTAGLKTSSKTTPKATASKGNTKSSSKSASGANGSSKPAVQSDSSFFGSSTPSTSKSGASAPATRGATSSTTGPKRTSSETKKKQTPNLLDTLLAGPVVNPIQEATPAPIVVEDVPKKVKKSVRWRPDHELEQIKLFTSELDQSEMHGGWDENHKLSETSEGEMLEEAKGEMIEEQDWFEPIEIEIEDVGNPPRGEGSREIEVQDEREKNVPVVVYESTVEIPQAPASPEPESLSLSKEEDESTIKQIPLDESIAAFELQSEPSDAEKQRLAAVLQSLGVSNDMSESLKSLPRDQQNQVQQLQPYQAQPPQSHPPMNPAASATSSSGSAIGGLSLDQFGINPNALSSLASLISSVQAPTQPPPQFQHQPHQPPPQWPQSSANPWQQQPTPQQQQQQHQQTLGGPSGPRVQPQGFHRPGLEEFNRRGGRGGGRGGRGARGGRGRGARGGAGTAGVVCHYYKTPSGCTRDNCEFLHQ